MVQYRLAKLESLLKQEISDIIKREIRDLETAIITVTNIILSRDLRHAKVYVSIYAEEAQQKKIMRKLKNASGLVRGIIGRRIRIRYIPEINFIQDKSMEEVEHIYKLMQDIKEERAQKNSSGIQKE